jgi:hypothetical protein
MGARSGGGGGFGSGAKTVSIGSGKAFADTYGTEGIFFAADGVTGKAKYVGSTDRYYQVGVYGNGPKMMDFPIFNTAKEANDFMDKLMKNGFKPQGGKQKKFKQVYGYLDSHYKVQWTTDKKKKNNGW